MVKKNISRKKFLTSAVGGLAGLKLLSRNFSSGPSDTLEKRFIGKTKIQVSPVCFGAPRTNEESLIRYAVDRGIYFIDTGQSYGNGKNENLVGKAVSGRRKEVVIQTKIRLEMNELPSGGKGKKGGDEIRSVLNFKLEGSLKALYTNYIDILLYHDAVDENLLFHPEVMKFFSGIKSSGVIRAHGFSTHNDFLNLHKRNNEELFYDVIMVPFNHKGSFVHSVSGRFSEWDQGSLISVLEEAGRKGVGVIAMKTCSGGKYSPSPGIEPGFREAVRWVIQHPYISSAAVAMASFEQVDDHIS